jgi:HK97 family phage major capsid protein
MTVKYEDLLRIANDKATEAEAIAEGDEFDQEKFDALMQEAESYRERAKAVKAAQTLRSETKPEAKPEPPKSGLVITTDEADNALKARPYKSFGSFLMDVKSAAGNIVDQRLLPLRQDDGSFALEGAMGADFVGSLTETASKAVLGLNEGVGSQGGFLVGTDRAGGLLARVYEVGEILRRVKMTGISANSNGMTFNAEDETSRADGSRRGGVQAYWMAEAGDKTASKPKFRQIELKLKKEAGLVYATDELLQDANALESYIMSMLPEELNFVAEDSIINGTGVGMPLGILASGALVSVPKETAQAADTVVGINVLKMWSRMWGRSRKNAVWLINQDVEPQLYGLEIPMGTGGQLIYMPPGGISGTPYATIFGREVIAVEYCSTVGTVGDIILADFSQYQAIEKGGIQSASSIHVQFLTDQTVYRFIMRIDGEPMWASPLTPFKGTNTLSPFVALASRD